MRERSVKLVDDPSALQKAVKIRRMELEAGRIWEAWEIHGKAGLGRKSRCERIRRQSQQSSSTWEAQKVSLMELQSLQRNDPNDKRNEAHVRNSRCQGLAFHRPIRGCNDSAWSQSSSSGSALQPRSRCLSWFLVPFWSPRMLKSIVVHHWTRSCPVLAFLDASLRPRSTKPGSLDPERVGSASSWVSPDQVMSLFARTAFAMLSSSSTLFRMRMSVCVCVFECLCV